MFPHGGAGPFFFLRRGGTANICFSTERDDEYSRSARLCVKTFPHCWLREVSRPDADVFLLDPRPTSSENCYHYTGDVFFLISSQSLPQVLLLRCQLKVAVLFFIGLALWCYWLLWR